MLEFVARGVCKTWLICSFVLGLVLGGSGFLIWYKLHGG